MSTLNARSQPTPKPMAGLLLTGLDGTNPLGFLAALGLLRILSESRTFEDLRMRWDSSPGTWVPTLHASGNDLLDEDSLLAGLTRTLVKTVDDHPVQLLESFQGGPDGIDRRPEFFKGLVDKGDRTQLNWAGALTSDFAPLNAINQLQIVRRDYFYGNLTAVIRRTEENDLRRSIFHKWDYNDALDNQSLHLDPSEDRRHAYQWNKPAGDPDRNTRGGMLGANRLALEAFALFPSFPVAGTLRTVGFTGTRSSDTRWTWPIWNLAIPLPVVRSLLALAILQREDLDRSLPSGAARARRLDAVGSQTGRPEAAELVARGIVAVFRTRRILVGKTPNFTPARRIA